MRGGHRPRPGGDETFDDDVQDLKRQAGQKARDSYYKRKGNE